MRQQDLAVTTLPPGQPRRLIVKDPAGARISLNGHGQIELTSVPNADARAPMMAQVQEACSLGCWHDTGPAVPLYLWGSD